MEINVEEIKAQYRPGVRVRCDVMNDPIHPIPSGTKGEVAKVDDMGKIFVRWENGRYMALMPEIDSFTML